MTRSLGMARKEFKRIVKVEAPSVSLTVPAPSPAQSALEGGSRKVGESMADYLGRFSADLADASLISRQRGDDVHAIFFSIKACEILSLAKALGYRLPIRPLPTQTDGGPDANS